MEYRIAGHVFEAKFCLALRRNENSPYELLNLSDKCSFEMVAGESIRAHVDIAPLFPPLNALLGQVDEEAMFVMQKDYPA